MLKLEGFKLNFGLRCGYCGKTSWTDRIDAVFDKSMCKGAGTCGTHGNPLKRKSTASHCAKNEKMTKG